MISQTNDRSELMRAGVRARVAGLVGTAKVDARHWSPPVLLAVLCAGAFAPLLAAGVGGAALIATSIGAITSVGGGALSEVLLQAVGRLKPEGSKPASAEKLQADLERRIQQALEAGGENAARLRGEIARALDEIGAVGAALEAAVQIGDRQVQEQLAVGFSEVGEQFSEFRFVLTDLHDELREIQDGVNEQSGRSRLATDLLYQQGTDIRSLLDLVSELEARTRAGRVTGRGAGDEGQPRWADECPYRGLVPFSEADAHVFYGRQRDTARLVSTLAAHLTGPGLVVVTGASGAGKSSLLRAGLLPAIGRGGLSRAARHWPRRLIEEPTRSPLSRLATLLAAMAGLDAPSVLSSLASAPEQAHLLVRQAVEVDAGRRGLDAATAADCRLLLVIDQFEEVFRVATGQDGAAAATERATFIAALRAASTTPCGPGEAPAALVVIAVRGDFTDRCANFAVLAAALQDSQFVVSPMTGPDLRLAITGPAAAAGLDVEAGLAETILSELRSAAGGYDAGALPLVSQIMLAVWEHREGHNLTLRGYAQTDGVTDAVASSADAAYASLAAPARRLVRQVFHQLVDVSPTGQLARHAAPRAELYNPGDTGQGHANDFDRSGADGGNRADDIDQILDAFTRRRLIVIDADTVQIGHDILLEAWPRLRDWLEPDLTGYALYSQLRDAAADWARHDHAASYLYQGEHLAAMTQVRSRWEASPDRYPPLAGTPAEFLSASSTAQARRARRRQGVVTALAGLLVIAVVTSVIALRARQSAVQARDVAISGQLESQSEAIGDTDPVISKLLSVAAYRIHPSDQAIYAMLAAGALPGVNVIQAGSNWTYTVAFSPHGKLLASGNYDGTIRLWNAATGQQIGKTLNGHAGRVNSVAFSPDGKTLASGVGLDGIIQLWNVATGQQIRPPLNGHAGQVNSVAFSPDGTTLASGSNDAVQFWNAANGQLTENYPVASNVGPVNSVAFSLDGQTLASGNQNGTSWLWKVAPGQLTENYSVTGNNGPVNSVTFSPDGQTLASGSNGEVQLWNAATGQPTETLKMGDVKPVNSVAFSPDGSTLASGSSDDTVRLWDTATGQQIGPSLTGHTGWVESVAFSPDGSTLASSSTDQTVRLWNVAIAKPMGNPLGDGAAPVSSVAFSPNGKILANGNADGTVRLLAAATGQQIASLVTQGARAVNSIACSPDGKTLASGYANGTIRLWDVLNRQPIGNPLTGGTAPVNSVAFSRNGKTLASGYANGTIRLWDVATGQPIGHPLTGRNGPVNSVAFSPDGQTLASGTADNTIQLWDVATGRRIHAPLTGHTYAVTSVMFSSHGMLASGSVDYTIRLWNPASGDQLPESPLTGDTGAVNSVAFSPDGQILASGSADGTVRLWDVATGQQIGASFTGQTGAVNSVAFSPDGQALASGDADGTVQVWDVAYMQDIMPDLCASAGRSLTRAEWTEYVGPSLAYQNVCPSAITR
jgi:WD40 repeat protein